MSLSWPENKRAALSLSFDDTRTSAADVGIEVLDAYDVKATFYATISTMDQRLGRWEAAAKNGHEIGNHTIHHPCTGNYPWCKHALEGYTLERMEEELLAANDAIYDRLGVRPTSFAYPCGQTFVGRGAGIKSYAPLIAEHFSSGRLWATTYPNVPATLDLTQLGAFEFDNQTLEFCLGRIRDALDTGDWVIFVGHDVGEDTRLSVDAQMLDSLCRTVTSEFPNLWVAPVGTISGHLHEQSLDACDP